MGIDREDRQFEGAIAILDILGFKSRTPCLSPQQVRDTVIGGLIGLMQWGEERFAHDLRRTPSSRVEYLYFADTLVLLLERRDATIHEDASVVMESMVFVCQLVAAGSIVLGVPVRGALAYGEGLVCRDPLFYIGEAFLDAHNLEERQDWAGISLCDSALELVEQEDVRTTQWDVPTKILKDGAGVRKTEQRRAIDWPPVVRATRVLPNWDLCFPGRDSDRAVRAKYTNTKSFFDRSAHAGPEGLPDQLDKWCKEWRKRYRAR